MPPKTNKKLHIQVYNLWAMVHTSHTRIPTLRIWHVHVWLPHMNGLAKTKNKNDQNVYITFDYYHHLGFCLFFTTTVLLLCLVDEVCPGELLAPSDSLLVGAGISEGNILLRSSSTY